MTVQWVLVASFLYFELGFVLLLSLQFISPKIWRSIFHFHLWKIFVKKANMYFSILIFVLILFFLDSIRDMNRYSSKTVPAEFDAELQMHVKLFRSQRNFYISGFALFLWLVIRRLVVLIIIEAELINRDEEAAKLAQNSTEDLQKLLKSAKETKPVKKFETFEEIKKLEEEIEVNKCEIRKLQKSKVAIQDKDQILQEEHTKLVQRNEQLREMSS